MAEAKSGDKSEKATPHKLREARKKGQVPRSRDLASAIGLLVALKLSAALMPQWLTDFRTLFALAFSPLAGPGVLDNSFSLLFSGSLSLLARMLLPLAAIPLAIILFSMLPGGWVFAIDHFFPKFQRMNPLAHFGRIASAQHASEMGKSIVKALVLGLVLWSVASSALTDFFALKGATLDATLIYSLTVFTDALMSLILLFIAFALIDVPLQAFLFARQQKMSKQEVKDEYKSTEGRPEIKQRVRQIQQQLAQRSVRKTLPAADVVIVNPSHYAVALKYDESRAEAPYLIAKGVDEMALFIRSLARELEVEVIEIPPLARACYHTTQVNQQIPTTLYRAVALVLNHVLQLKAFRSGKRRSAPVLPDSLPVPSELAEPREPK
ncbi:flagellar type III secretion system protein FlhB [Craterilacuibacter sp.]|uniref:flagellar type III secretion system protein FlhB n=1 Tax=Craterilacuibacter sp. TaxID=2870909 RepID=UPI003F2D8F24